MKQLLSLFLLVLCGCATVDMSRLVPSQSQGVPDLSPYTHLVVAKPTGNVEPGTIQSIIMSELNKSKFFIIVDDSNFQDSEDKFPLLLNSAVALEKSEEPVKTVNIYNPLANRNESVHVRDGMARSTVQFKLSEFRTPAQGLYDAQKSQTVTASTKGVSGITPANINYQVMYEKCVQDCVSELVKGVFPHYEITKYWIYTGGWAKQEKLAAIGYFTSKDYAKTEASCRQILESAKEKKIKNTALAPVNFLLGLSLEAQGKFDDAIKMYDAAILQKSQPDFFKARECAIKAKETYAKLNGVTPPPATNNSADAPAATEAAK